MNIAAKVKAEEKLALELRDYEGQWVAVRDSKLQFAAPTLQELITLSEAYPLEVEIFQTSSLPAFF